ncbi:stage II sporulation protein P [Candidatus Avoscillospira sp. LCP25S3_F1]|uniref:stage II sporulation protein P n=1 Tax=Candidatus Avoscillospira sp. LCP25S3_F1 TaxID=3438825 RepID=UPI003F920498
MQSDKLRVRRRAASMLTMALALRLMMALGVEEWTTRTLEAWLAPPVPAVAMAATAPEQTQEPERTPEQQQEESVLPPSEGDKLVFTEEDAAAITIGGACTYDVDPWELLQRESVLNFDQDGPTVLIVHTHTSEAYTMEAGWEYDENETARTQDTEYSVVRVGRVLAEELEARGISVLHDTSFNDYPSYNGAYNSTLKKIQQWVEEYPSIQMVIDIHRDAAANEDGTPVHHAVTLDGRETAQLMLVVGTDQGGLSHPGWRDNLSWALKLQAVLNRQWPGLCRNLDLRTERFNQHMTPGSLLIEVGSSGNTLKEALAAAELLADGLADLIEGT